MKGPQKVHAEHVMEAISHDLKQFRGIAASMGQNQKIEGGLCLAEELFQAVVRAKSCSKSSQESILTLEIFSSKI